MTEHFDDDPDFNEFDDEEIKSRSEIKREAEALQALGGSLTKLPASQLDSMNLPEELRSALADYQRFTSRTAMKRQLQYIGRVMRNIEAEPIQQALNKLRVKDHQQVVFFHRLEKWRDRLLSEGDSALGELLTEAPEIDRQQLRQMVRNAQREAKMNKPPKNTRAIFQYLKEVLSEESK